MKILQIFGAVVAVHLLAFIFIFASPGCQSGPRNIPTPDATMPVGPAPAPVSYTPNLVIPQPVDLAAPAPSITYTPVNEPGHATPTRPGSPAAAAITPARSVAEVTSVSTYTVGKGDSLWSIANKNHLTVAELAKANNLSVGVALRPGQKLLIPGGKVPAVAPKELAAAAPATGKAATTAPARSGDAMTYTVLPGESLGAIARKFQMKTGELAAANSITDPSKVRAGQQLVIPGFKAVGAKTSASAPAGKTAAETSAAGATPTATTPHFEIAAPPPGQDLDSGLKGAGTEVPTVKVEDAQPPKK